MHIHSFFGIKLNFHTQDMLKSCVWNYTYTLNMWTSASCGKTSLLYESLTSVQDLKHLDITNIWWLIS